MNHLLPNATAEAVGFTIPGRSSSLRDHSKRPSSKHGKKASLDKSRDEVVRHLRSLSIGGREANTKERISLDDPSVLRRQAFKRPTSPASTSSGSIPISQYRNYNKPSTDHNGGSVRQTGLRIRTFRPTDIPDSRDSPDICAHPANSLPESPVDPLLGSPTIPVLAGHPPNRPHGPRIHLTSESRANPTPHISLPPSSLLKHTEDTSVMTEQAPAVTHETRTGHSEKIMHPESTHDEHYHGSCNYVQTLNDTFYPPAQHFATGVEGKVIKIPDALGESLEIAKDRVPKKGYASMGWE